MLLLSSDDQAFSLVFYGKLPGIIEISALILARWMICGGAHNTTK
jgi:hypothetical protein